jgi:tetratricopeptide (TPR) repeat protein
MTHPSREAIAAFIEGLAAAEEADVAAHLEMCASCRDIAEEEQFAAALRSPSAWAEFDAHDHAPDDLLMIASRAHSEDAEARDLLADYIAKPLRLLWPGHLERPELQTAGVVRVLCAAAHAECSSEPANAVILADAAIAIAEALPANHYFGSALYLLRAAAWRERARALRLTSEFAAALDAVEHSARNYARGPSTPLDSAQLQYVKACIRADQDELSAAEVEIAASLSVFEQFGDVDGWMKAMTLSAYLRYRRCEYGAALASWLRLLAHADSIGDRALGARLANNVANAYLHLNDTSNAAPYFTRALVTFMEFGFRQEIARTRWGLARLVLFEGRYEDALRRLPAAIRELRERGLKSEPLRAELDLVEAQIALGRHRAARDLCRALVKRCKAAGLPDAALRALGYLRDLDRQLKREHVRHVRDFLERLEHTPRIAFVELHHPGIEHGR